MNLPNKLTVLRMIMVPFFMAAALIDFPFHNFVALAVFVIASATDALDGHLARKNNLVTNFGKFMDPLADKILVMAALVCLVADESIGSAAVIIILAREFMVSGLRLVTAGEGIVVAAGIWGKLKTAFTMGAIVVIYVLNGAFFAGWLPADSGMLVGIVNRILIWIAAVLTLISGIQYLWAYRKYIDPTK